MAFNINLNTKIMKTPYSHLKQVLKVFSYQFPDNLASACFLCSAVIYSQASKIFTIIKVCWTVLAFTHILPFIPSTSSNGYNCDNSWIISHLGAKSLQTKLKKVRGRSAHIWQTPHYYQSITKLQYCVMGAIKATPKGKRIKLHVHPK